MDVTEYSAPVGKAPSAVEASGVRTPEAPLQGMRILLLTTHFPPERTGNAPLLGELCQDLASSGHVVRVLAGPAEHHVPDLPKRYRRFGLSREQMGPIAVTRVNGIPIPWAWPRRLMVLSWFPVAAFWVGLAMGRCDVILCPSPPLWLGITAKLLSRVQGVPYVYVVQDLWPDAPIRLGLVRSRALICMLRAIEQTVYRGARRIITIMPTMTRRLVQLGVPPDKIDEIANWVDVDFFGRALTLRLQAFRASLALNADDVLVLYSGNMGRSHPVGLVVQAAVFLRHRADIHFLLVGAGHGLAPAKAAAVAAGLQNVCFLDFQPREMLPEMLASADIAVVTQLSGMGAFSLPSRMYMFMAAGLCIVGSFDADSGAAELLREAGCGLQVDPSDAKGLAAALVRLADDSELRRQLGAAGRDYVLRCCARQAATASYERSLLRVAGAQVD